MHNNQSPKQITKASEALTNHPFDKLLKKNNGNNNNNCNNENNINNHNNENNNNNNKISDETTNLSFAQIEDKPYCCDKVDHKSSTCSVKNKPKPE